MKLLVLSNWKFVFLLFLEFILIAVILFLGVKIIDHIKGKVKGIQYVTKIDKKSLIIDPSGELQHFYEPKPNSVQIWNPEWLGYEIKNYINSDTLNEEKEYSVKKAPNTYRIVTIGDSFTYGQFVKTKENYSKVLEIQLNKYVYCNTISNFEVINLGVPGYDLNYTVERFIKRGKKYDPDLVIWLLNSWNFYQLKEYMIPQMEQYGEISNTFNKETKEYTIIEKLNKEFKASYTNNEIIEIDKKILDRFNNNFDKNIVFFGLNLDKKYQSLIISRAKTREDNALYSDVFNTWGNEKYHLLDGHPNPEGHRKIAEDVISYLSKNILQTCQIIKPGN